MLLSDKEIIELCEDSINPLITPFVDHLVSVEQHETMLLTEFKKVLTWGLSSFGYDLRLGNKFKIFTNVSSSIIDPKAFNEDVFIEHEGDTCIIPPNSFILAHSLEKLTMPRNITGLVIGKSTFARVGVNCLATPLEAGWSGYVTLEFSNTTPLPVKMYAGEGCCQVLFMKGNDCLTSYADRNGKYQNQPAEPVLPKV